MSKEIRPTPDSLTVVDYPHPILKKRAADVPQLDEWVKALIARMKTLMVEHEGVGLAAPQVGISLRLFVFSPTGKPEDARAVVNPVFSNERGKADGEEGCLSLPEIRTKVTRFESLHIEGLDEHGNPVSEDLVDYPARIAQHEYDHLDGILIIDRMTPMAKIANRKKIKALEEKYPES